MYLSTHDHDDEYKTTKLLLFEMHIVEIIVNLGFECLSKVTKKNHGV